MRWRRQLAAWLMAAASALLPARGACGATRITLLMEAHVATDAILLANLLPENAPASVVTAAEEVFLGSAPQQGATRRFRGADIADAITRSGLEVARFEIPEEISVERVGRPLNGEELLASIRSAMWRFTLSPSAQAAILAMPAANLEWDSEIRVAPGDAKLVVEEIYAEPATGQASFRMAAESQEHGVPFEVIGWFTAKREGDGLQPTGTVAPQNGAANWKAIPQASGRAAPRGNAANASDAVYAGEAVLIKAGHTARLRLHSENANILVDVLALDSGHAGETIRVRMPLGGGILRALVTGAQELDATF